MSFSNILSSNATEPTKTTPRAMPAAKHFQRQSHTPNGDSGPVAAAKKISGKKASSPNENGGSPRKSAKPKTHSPALAKIPVNHINNHKIGVTMLSDKENEKIKKEMDKIEAMGLSDPESSAWGAEKEAFRMAALKRQADVDEVEDKKRKASNQLFVSFERWS